MFFVVAVLVDRMVCGLVAEVICPVLCSQCVGEQVDFVVFVLVTMHREAAEEGAR